MTLQVPKDYPIAPITRYDWNSPPYVPVIQIFPSVESARANIAAMVANEASTKANSSAARMYLFNLFSQNNWNNQSYAEAFKLAADYLALQMQKGLVRQIEAGIPEAASLVCTLLTSVVLFQVPEIKASVHPNAISAASQNVPQLENLKKEILQMYQFNNGNGMHPQQQMQPMQPGMYPGMHPNQMPMMHPGMPMYNNGMYPQQMQPMQHMQPPNQIQGGYAGPGMTSGFGSNQGQPQHSGEFMADSFGETDRYESRRPVIHQQQPEVIRQQQQYYHNAPEEKTVQTTPQITELQIEKGTEMDRAQHQLAYFGGVIHLDNGPRMELFQQKSSELAVAALEETNSPLMSDWQFALSLDEALASGLIRHQKRQIESNSQELMREWVAIGTPIIVGSGMKDYWEDIRSATSLVGVAKKIQALSISLEKKKSPENMGEINNILSFLSALDVRLTNMVNKFLAVNLNLPKVHIDTFTGDVDEIGMYLQNNYGPMESKAFADFSNELFDILVLEIDPETSHGLLEMLGDHNKEEYPLFPECYSVTYIFLNSKELGYQVTDTPLKISERTAPSLYRIVDSLLAHKKAAEMSTSADLLICADGVRYRVFRNYRVHSEYYIANF